MDGAYRLTCQSNGIYDGNGTYYHNLIITLNGFTLYTSSNVIWNSAIDSGTITIKSTIV